MAARRTTMNSIHQLATDMPIPPQKIFLAITENKLQLIFVIVEDLCKEHSASRDVGYYQTANSQKRRSNACGSNISVTIQGKICKQFREADNILAQQMVDVAAEQNKGVSVISADTDEFALLLHHYTKVYWDGNNGVACLRPGFY